jgi:hypothetical protein
MARKNVEADVNCNAQPRTMRGSGNVMIAQAYLLSPSVFALYVPKVLLVCADPSNACQAFAALALLNVFP